MNLDGSTGGQEERMIVLLVKSFACNCRKKNSKSHDEIYCSCAEVEPVYCTTYMYSILDSLDRLSNIMTISS